MLAPGLSRETANERDGNDPLAAFRSRFDLPADVVYLNGNSLGAPPSAARDALMREYGEWSTGLISSWYDAGWLEAPARVGDKIGRLVGAAPGQVLAADSTSVNLFKLLMAGVAARPGRRHILTQSSMFPTDVYVARRVAELTGTEVRQVDRGKLLAAIDEQCAVVLLMHVDYKTSDLIDLAAAQSACDQQGALLLADLCHSVAALPIQLDADGVDLAVGCTYKFLSGGPGAPAFVYVRRDLQETLEQPIAGWMGHRAPLDFADDYEAAEGAARFATGTPPILAYAALEASVDLWLEADLVAVREKSIALANYMLELVDHRLRAADVGVLSPREAAARGSQVSLTHPDARRLEAALIAQGVYCDHRPPDILRFGLAPLYNTYADVWDAVDALARLLSA